jgi:hypothetical protein
MVHDTDPSIDCHTARVTSEFTNDDVVYLDTLDGDAAFSFSETDETILLYDSLWGSVVFSSLDNQPVEFDGTPGRGSATLACFIDYDTSDFICSVTLGGTYRSHFTYLGSFHDALLLGTGTDSRVWLSAHCPS